jgi:hypothetical protein
MRLARVFSVAIMCFVLAACASLNASGSRQPTAQSAAPRLVSSDPVRGFSGLAGLTEVGPDLVAVLATSNAGSGRLVRLQPSTQSVKPIGSVGTDPVGVGDVSGNLVVAHGPSPRGPARLADTVLEFSPQGRVLETTKLSNSVAVVTAWGDVWIESIAIDGSGALTEFRSTGRDESRSFKSLAIPEQHGASVGFSGDGRLGVLHSDAEGRLTLEVIGASGKEPTRTVSVSGLGLPSVVGLKVGFAVAVNSQSDGGLFVVNDDGAVQVPMCGHRFIGLAASSSRLWVLSQSNEPGKFEVATVTATGCSLPQVLSRSSSAVVAVASGKGLWVLTRSKLYQLE